MQHDLFTDCTENRQIIKNKSIAFSDWQMTHSSVCSMQFRSFLPSFFISRTAGMRIDISFHWPVVVVISVFGRSVMRCNIYTVAAVISFDFLMFHAWTWVASMMPIVMPGFGNTSCSHAYSHQQRCR